MITTNIWGIKAALIAFISWGLFPVYFKQLESLVSAQEIIAHRILWTFVYLSILFIPQKKFRSQIIQLFYHPTQLFTLFISALLFVTNLGLYIWAITNQHILESGIGYFFIHIFSVLLGILFLKEKLSPMALLATLITFSGLLFLLVSYHMVPWIALALGGCFGFYSLVRKKVPLSPWAGLYMENLFLLLPALIYLYFYGQVPFNKNYPFTTTGQLLLGAGVIHIIPNACYLWSLQVTKLSTIGLIQFITPIMDITFATFFCNEPLTKAYSYAIIFMGVASLLAVIEEISSKNYKTH